MLARRDLAELGGELDALGLAAGQRRRRLPELDVAEADLVERLEAPCDARDVGEEADGLLDAHLEHLGDVLALVADLERLAVVALAVADLAGHVDVGQEVHLDLDLAVALAGLAAAALDVEAEAAGLVAAQLALRRQREELADVVEHAGVGGRVAARRAPDGRLVDVDDLVEVLRAVDAVVLAGAQLGAAVEARRHALVQDLVDERGLAGAGDAGDAGEGADAGSETSMSLRLCMRAPRTVNHCSGRRRWPGSSMRRRPARKSPVSDAGSAMTSAGVPCGHHVAAVLAGAGAHVDDVIGRAHRLLVVLDHEHRVAEVAQAQQRLDEPAVVALVQADAGLVEDVQHADQRRADLRREPDALRLAAGERGRGALRA